jgi:spore maturation protein SpmB
MVKIVCKIIYLSLPNLACFAPLRESFPRVRVFQVTGKFAQVAQIFNDALKLRGRVSNPPPAIPISFLRPLRGSSSFAFAQDKLCG